MQPAAADLYITCMETGKKQRHVEKLNSVSQTAAWMERIVRRFHSDVMYFDGWEFYRFYSYVRDLPYIDDGDDEQVSRPKWTLPIPGQQMQGGRCEFRDCDDKSVIIGCWLYRQRIPFRFIACAYDPGVEIHHCILQIKEPRMFVDSTYPGEDDFPPTKNYHNVTPLTGWIHR